MANRHECRININQRDNPLRELERRYGVAEI